MYVCIYVYIYLELAISSILSSNDDIKETPINEIKGKKLRKDSILVSMCM
jgi:hypothetical protein